MRLSPDAKFVYVLSGNPRRLAALRVEWDVSPHLEAIGEPDAVRDTSLAQRNPRLFSPLSGAV